MVLNHAVVLAASSIHTVTELQNRGDHGAGCLIAHLNCQIDWLNTRRGPREETITFRTQINQLNIDAPKCRACMALASQALKLRV